VFRLTAPEEENITEWLDQIQSLDGVKWAELSPLRYTCDISDRPEHRTDAPPNDPYYPLQWYLHKIHAAAAWDVTRGDSSVTIAIIDIGVDIYHSDLILRRWINYAELNGTLDVDDDENGFIDDVHGWDFYDDDNDPKSRGADSHGTHVAGIAAAATDNGYGMAGIGWNCRYMAVRVGAGHTIAYGYEGIIYAAASGADVISLSWGSNTPSNIELIVTEYAAEQGALVVAAVGNDPPDAPYDHFPAAYKGVLAVTAVDTGDILASFSNYNNWVDISAPGRDIFSTVPNGYGVLSGTSMATPMVAGAAALLKTIHPDWTPQQLRLQLMLSADPINNLNPDLADSIGFGRLNLYGALTDNLTGFELTSINIFEGDGSDGDGVIDPNENINITVQVTNLLSKTATVTGWIHSIDPYIQIVPHEIDFGAVVTGESVDNTDLPFQANISRNTRSGQVIHCKLILRSEALPSLSFPFNVTVRPPYDTHDNGNVALTVTNFGALGYYDYIHRQGVGQGMRYPKDGLTGLFHGSLMVGVGPDRVSDCAFGDSADIRFDFIPQEAEFVIRTDEVGIQEGYTRFNDDRSRRPLNIEVEQISISYPAPPDDDYVILHYSVINNGENVLEDMRVALFLDWDIIHANNNLCRWNNDVKLGWMEHVGDGFPVFGVAMLDQEPDFHVAIDNYEEWNRGNWNKWGDRAKFLLMQSDFNQAEGLEPTDYSQMLGTQPITLAAGDSVIVTFAILAGEDPSDLANNLNAASVRINNHGFRVGRCSEVPGIIELISIYPQPLNGWINLKCRIPEAGTVLWQVFSQLGREVLPGGFINVVPGTFNLPMDMTRLPTGKYFVRLIGAEGRLNVPVVLIK